MSNSGRNQIFYFIISSCVAHFSALCLSSPISNCTDANIDVCSFLSRHRVVNLFLQGYRKTWVANEDLSFEEKLVEDLAVSAKVIHSYIRSYRNYFSNLVVSEGKIHPEFSGFPLISVCKIMPRCSFPR